MNESTTVTTVNSVRTAPEPSERTLDVPALARVLAEIRSDSQRRPETYLRDTVVPHGGE